MNTEEAIEFCETFKDKITDIDMENGDAEMMEEYNNEISKVISLLQQGEKYRQMWLELYDIASEFNFFPLMDKLEQKYFPEGGEARRS